MLHNKSFKLEDLLQGGKKLQVDYNPLWMFLENMDRKLADRGGLSGVPLKEVIEAVYEYGVITIGMDKADLEQRIENLTEQNIVWFTKSDLLQKEVDFLKQRIKELE